MAYDYNDASSHRITFGDVTFLDGATQIAGMCMVNLDDTAADHYLFSKYSGSTGLLFLHDDVGSGTGRTNMFKIYIHATSAKFIEGATNSATTGSWQCVGWNWTSNDANGLQLFIGGTEDANSPTNTTGQGSFPNMTQPLDVGRLSASSGYMDGQIGQCALWVGTTLSSAEHAALANYTSPFLIQPQNLVWAPEFIRGAYDKVTGATGTITGATVSAHHPLVMPSSQFVPQAITAAAGRINSLAYYGGLAGQGGIAGTGGGLAG